MKNKEYPNDRRITVLRRDGSIYRTWESEHELMIQKSTPAEIRCNQQFRKDIKNGLINTDVNY